MVHTKPQQEALAIAHLGQQGMKTNCPLFKQESIRHRQVLVNKIPLFPRLAFAVSTAVEADIILMDEWLSVGDSNFILKAEKRLNDFIKRSSILVIASHSEDLIKKTTNQVLHL